MSIVLFLVQIQICVHEVELEAYPMTCLTSGYSGYIHFLDEL